MSGQLNDLDWAGLREQGPLLVDTHYQQLAVYVGACGHVVIAHTHFAAPADVIALEPELIPAFVHALLAIQPSALKRQAEQSNEIDNAYASHQATEAIERTAVSAKDGR